MKPAPFTYHRPTGLAEALEVLAAGEGKVLAGGQSLLPLMSMRLASPASIVDINALPGLSEVLVAPDAVRVGALVRHSDLLAHDGASMAIPLLRQATRLVAHGAIRNRGTSVGSLCHADPSAELPAVLALLGGHVEAASQRGSRTIAVQDFFAGPMESSLRHDEIAVSASFPVPEPGTSTAMVEVARRHGDYAVCGVAAAVVVRDGALASARCAYVSAGPVPEVVDLTEAVRGQAPGRAAWADAGELAFERLDPDGDIHATARYRRHLARVLTVRALIEAAGRQVLAA